MTTSTTIDRVFEPHAPAASLTRVGQASTRSSAARSVGSLCAGSTRLDRQVEQRTEPSDDTLARHVLATAELDVESVAEVGERVAGGDRVDR
jgi:hypothetical protein